jgi:hypothetical protein
MAQDGYLQWLFSRSEQYDATSLLFINMFSGFEVTTPTRCALCSRRPAGPRAAAAAAGRGGMLANNSFMKVVLWSWLMGLRHQFEPLVPLNGCSRVFSASKHGSCYGRRAPTIRVFSAALPKRVRKHAFVRQVRHGGVTVFNQLIPLTAPPHPPTAVAAGRWGKPPRVMISGAHMELLLPANARLARQSCPGRGSRSGRGGARWRRLC